LSGEKSKKHLRFLEVKQSVNETDMKILFTIPAVGSLYGGPAKTVFAMARSLGDRGHNVDIVTTVANVHQPLDVPLNIWNSEENYRIRYFSYFRPFGEYKFSLSMTKWLWNNVSEYQIVISSAVFNYPSEITHATCWLKRRPYVVIAHYIVPAAFRQLQPPAGPPQSWEDRKNPLLMSLHEETPGETPHHNHLLPYVHLSAPVAELASW